MELVSKANAEGIVAATGFVLMMGSVAYGFDQILILAFSSVVSLLIIPFVTNHSWRRNKAKAILSYLAVRSVARRYAYGHHITDFNMVLTFRGRMREVYDSPEEWQQANQNSQVDFGSGMNAEKAVWICLMRGAVAVLSERLGGAKLEFLGPVCPELKCRKPLPKEQVSERAVVIEGAGISKGRTIALESDYPAAIYVFEKKLSRLIFELPQRAK